ncbi:hypothetical protein F0U59_27355 [Archangium gephyra]|nr:hypothetical protein F0U59_27355 [Archangium gephyra]
MALAWPWWPRPWVICWPSLSNPTCQIPGGSGGPGGPGGPPPSDGGVRPPPGWDGGTPPPPPGA